MHIYDLDLLGTFAFAVFGAHQAIEKQFNIYGILMCAALTSLGGGTIRETLLHHLPAYFSDHSYLLATAAGAAAAGILHHYRGRRHRTMLLIDALGLATFALIGAERADAARLGLVGAIFFAALTAAGGGIMTDVITRERPKALTVDLYILPAAIAGALYHVLAGITLPYTTIASCCLLVPLVVRVRWLAATGRLPYLRSPGQDAAAFRKKGRARHRRRPAPVPK